MYDQRRFFTGIYAIVLFVVFWSKESGGGVLRVELSTLTFILGFALLSIPFGDGLEGGLKQGKFILHLAWLLIGTGFFMSVLAGAEGHWDASRTSALVVLLFTTAAWHLYSTSYGKLLALVPFLATLWWAAITYGGSMYLVIIIHVLVVAWDQRGKIVFREPMPLVWQAVCLYGVWLWGGTAVALASGSGEGVIEVSPLFLGVAVLPMALLALWSLRHSLLRDGTAKGLAHFGVVILLLGVIPGSIWSTATQAIIGNEEATQLVPLTSLVRWGSLLALAGSALVLTKRE